MCAYKADCLKLRHLRPSNGAILLRHQYEFSARFDDAAEGHRKARCEELPDEQLSTASNRRKESRMVGQFRLRTATGVFLLALTENSIEFCAAYA